MGNPYLDRIKARSLMGHGKESEKRIAKILGARLQPNSGAMRGAKSDAVMPQEKFRLEMKSTTSHRMSIEIGWLSKITSEALTHGQTPGVVVSFVTADGKPALKHYAEWVLIPAETFRELTTP